MKENYLLDQGAQKQSEHISLANDMSSQIIGEFNPTQQNEMIKTNRQAISENRQLQIEKMEKDISELKDALQNL